MTESPETTEDQASGAYVTAFGRGLAVIRAFSAENPTLTIADVAKATNLNRATARRFLHTLEEEAYVGRDGTQYYLRPRVLELGYGAMSSMPDQDIIQQYLREIAERLGEACSAGVLEGHDIRLIARAQSSHPRVMAVSFSVGARIPAYLSAIGRVLLAELSDTALEEYFGTATFEPSTPRTIADTAHLRQEIAKVRARGYALTDQEIEVGLQAAAVPVRVEGKPTVGLSVALHTTRASQRDVIRHHVPVLQDAAEELEHVLKLRN